jgi:hypothetical protein
LPKKACINQGFINEIESRAKIGTSETLERLAVALDIEVVGVRGSKVVDDNWWHGYR